MIRRNFGVIRAIVFLMTVLLSTTGHAETVSFSGFMSLVGGQVLSGGGTSSYAGVDCPCFVADWTNMGVYNKSFSVRPESRVGMRMNAKLSDTLSAVVQVDARATQGSSGATLEWAYLSYVPADDWVVQLGRKRLPIYYYSDFQDVGFAYPWVRPPQDLYGWEVNNFNAVTVARTGRWGEWDSRASVFYGRENSSSNLYAGLDYPGESVDVTWRNILGADLELTRDWFNLRMVYIQSKIDMKSNVSGPLVEGGVQHIYGLSANANYDNWLVRSELSYFDRWKDMGYKSKAGMLGVGYHVGDYTPMVTYSRFMDANSYGDPNWENDSLMLSVRYDLNATSAIKVQYDKFRELSLPGSTSGNADVLSASYDRVF
ncbi:porin [Sulfuriferula thiophila]|uniref:porin n=1 Tax=Sulfuriferula thiophila TaxID=1781211 RepID=UPI000F613161|nr:porin [Sulfuriferula thiophila]